MLSLGQATNLGDVPIVGPAALAWGRRGLPCEAIDQPAGDLWGQQGITLMDNVYRAHHLRRRTVLQEESRRPYA